MLFVRVRFTHCICWPEKVQICSAFSCIFTHADLVLKGKKKKKKIFLFVEFCKIYVWNHCFTCASVFARICSPFDYSLVFVIVIVQSKCFFFFLFIIFICLKVPISVFYWKGMLPSYTRCSPFPFFFFFLFFGNHVFLFLFTPFCSAIKLGSEILCPFNLSINQEYNSIFLGYLGSGLLYSGDIFSL